MGTGGEKKRGVCSDPGPLPIARLARVTGSKPDAEAPFVATTLNPVATTARWQSE
jgi:hypothetical protein